MDQSKFVFSPIVMRNFLLVGFAVWLMACGETGEKIQEEFMPTARGEIGEIILVIDSTQWSGPVGSALRQTFREPLPGLPQDEPMFNINKVSPLKLNSVLKSATNMIFVTTLDSKTRESDALRAYFTNQSLKTIQKDTSIFMSVKRDEFARGQVVMFLYSDTEGRLAEKVTRNRVRLQNYYEEQARKRLQARILVKRETQLEKTIAEDHPFTIKVPFGWEQAKNARNFYWIRKLGAQKEQNVFVYYEPYHSTSPFDDVPRFRDKITEMYLRDSEKPDIYVTRQQRDDIQGVFIRATTFDDKYAKEARGLWKVSDNSGGGPYISYTMVDEEQQILYYIEGYVYAPGGKKKNLLREVDAILDTFKPKKAVEAK